MRKYLNFKILLNFKAIRFEFLFNFSFKNVFHREGKKKKREREKEITFDAIFLNCNST